METQEATDFVDDLELLLEPYLVPVPVIRVKDTLKSFLKRTNEV